MLGAHLGIDAIPEYWYTPWNNTAVSYLNGIDKFNIDNVIERFQAIKKALP